MQRLIYLHGFLSSPESHKASLMRAWLAQHRPEIHYQCPRLSSYPGQAIAQIKQLIEQSGYSQTGVVGSSLGGYWATWLAEVHDVRAVLVNPAAKPGILDHPDYLGVELRNFYSDEIYVLGEHDLTDLKSVWVETPGSPENIWLMAQTGDETCDYRLSAEKYRYCRQTIEPGGDHGFQGFARWIPEIVEFLQL